MRKVIRSLEHSMLIGSAVLAIFSVAVSKAVCNDLDFPFEPFFSPSKINSNLTKFVSYESLEGSKEKSITNLDLTNVPINDEQLIKIAERFPNLERLFLSGSKVTDVSMRQIHLPALKVLHLIGDAVGDDAFIDSSRFPRLTSLNLADTKVRKLKNISRLQLEDLTLNGINLQDSDFEPLSSCRSLKKLTAIAVPCTEQILACLPESLLSLDLYGCNLSDSSIEQISRLKQLEKLDLRGTKLSPKSGSSIAKLSRLRVLFLPWIGQIDEWLVGLNGLNRLEFLPINQFSLTERTGELLGNFPNLRNLFLVSKKLPESTLEIVGRMSKLEKLDLSNDGIDDSSHIVWRRLTKLKKLILRENEIGNATIAKLANLPLEELDISATKVTSIGLRSLRSMKMLNALNISNDPGIGENLELLRGLPLRYLRLAHSTLTDKQLDDLPGLPNLKSLDLSQNPGLSNKCLEKLARYESLNYLNIQGSKISDSNSLFSHLKKCEIIR